MAAPILSIAIVNLNYGRFLDAALHSVCSQCGEPVVCADGRKVLPLLCGEYVELLLADGGSSDDSLDVIGKYADKFAWWVSEPDTGQSNAFNKCFSKANGRYLTWLNADDVILPGALNKVVNEILKHPDCEWFTANSIRFTSDGRVNCGFWGPHYYPQWLQFKSSPFISFGPSTFFSKRIYEVVGKIDERFHYIMDTDLWCRFIVAGFKQRRIRCFFWGFRLHKASKTGGDGVSNISEETLRKMSIESEMSRKRSGYEMSSVLRFLVWVWRALDGSLFLHLLFQHYPRLFLKQLEGV